MGTESQEAPLRHDAPHGSRAAGEDHTTQVLIVDDHPPYRQLVRSMLDGSRCTVCGEASDGHEALAFMERVGVDIVILDHAMPEMSGLQVLEAMRELRLDVPVVLVSGAPDPRLRQQLLDAGAAMHFDKGDLHEAIDYVRRLCATPLP